MGTKFADYGVPFVLASVLVAIFYFMGSTGLMIAVVAFVGLPVAGVVWAKTDLALVAAFPVLLGMPFFLGVNRTPKIYLDEVLLLAILGVISLKVLFKKEIFPGRPFDFLIPVLCMAMMGVSLLTMPTTMISVRTFIETFGLGVLLCLCLLVPEMANLKNVNRIAIALAGLILLISLAGIVEGTIHYNPLWEYVERTFIDEYLYLSPELAVSTGAPYRPYVIFLHPSTGATAIGVCLPFVAVLLAGYSGVKIRLFAAVSLLAALAFIGVNGTRGVWVAVAVAIFIYVPRIWRIFIIFFPIIVCIGIIGMVFMSNSNFWDRVSDPHHFIVRLFYWEQALDFFEGYWLSGIGFQNFAEAFLSVADTAVVPLDIAADVATVATVDNILLMILVEQGVLGLGGFIALLLFLVKKLRESYATLRANGHFEAALYAKAGIPVILIYFVCGMFADVHLFAKGTKLLFMFAGLGWGLGLNMPRNNQDNSLLPRQ